MPSLGLIPDHSTENSQESGRVILQSIFHNPLFLNFIAGKPLRFQKMKQSPEPCIERENVLMVKSVVVLFHIIKTKFVRYGKTRQEGCQFISAVKDI